MPSPKPPTSRAATPEKTSATVYQHLRAAKDRRATALAVVEALAIGLDGGPSALAGVLADFADAMASDWRERRYGGDDQAGAWSEVARRLSQVRQFTVDHDLDLP